MSGMVRYAHLVLLAAGERSVRHPRRDDTALHAGVRLETGSQHWGASGSLKRSTSGQVVVPLGELKAWIYPIGTLERVTKRARAQMRRDQKSPRPD